MSSCALLFNIYTASSGKKNLCYAYCRVLASKTFFLLSMLISISSHSQYTINMLVELNIEPSLYDNNRKRIFHKLPRVEKSLSPLDVIQHVFLLISGVRKTGRRKFPSHSYNVHHNICRLHKC